MTIMCEMGKQNDAAPPALRILRESDFLRWPVRLTGRAAFIKIEASATQAQHKRTITHTHVQGLACGRKRGRNGWK
jgi:hypothetical protein